MVYGFKTWNGDAVTAISEEETTVRLVGGITVLAGTGTTNHVMPEFNEARGVIVATPFIYKYAFDVSARMPDSANMANNYTKPADSFWHFGNRFDNRLPTWVWNQAAEQITVTMHGDTLSDWRFVFYHYL